MYNSGAFQKVMLFFSLPHTHTKIDKNDKKRWVLFSVTIAAEINLTYLFLQ